MGDGFKFRHDSRGARGCQASCAHTHAQSFGPNPSPLSSFFFFLPLSFLLNKAVFCSYSSSVSHSHCVVCSITDRWRCEGQSAVGAGPHAHSIWEEANEEVGDSSAHRPTVSTRLLVPAKATGDTITCDGKSRFSHPKAILGKAQQSWNEEKGNHKDGVDSEKCKPRFEFSCWQIWLDG